MSAGLDLTGLVHMRDDADVSHPIDTAAVLDALGPWTTGTGPLHLRLERALLRAMRRGDLPPASRLPPERELAAALAVSRGTVVTAVRALRDAGWLASRQGSGTWVRVDAPRPLQVVSDPIGVASRSRRLSNRVLEHTPGVIDLANSSLWDMDAVPDEAFAALDPAELLAAGATHGYQPYGSARLRSALADRYTRAGLPTSADQILVTSGAQQALALVFAATLRAGDAAVVESPTYPGAIDALARAGVRLVSIPAESTWPSVSVLRDAVRESGARLIYLMPACHNPLGTVMTRSRRREIALLADELKAYVVTDDLLELVTDVPQPPALASFSRAERVLTVSSLSKVAWGGLRVGWLRGPADLISRVGRTRAAADYGMSPVTQHIACRLLGSLDEIAAQRREQLRANRLLVADLVARHLPGWTVAPADGGLSLWVRLPLGDADDLEQHAQRAGVAFLPGSAHSADDRGRNHLRLSCSQAPEVLVEGVERLALAWQAYLAAVDRRLSAG